ncbi:MAG: SDR family oxidoreductase [Methanoculleus sp.]
MNVAYSYAKKGIRSNVIAPGGVNTEILSGKDLNQKGAAIYAAGTVTNPRMGEAIEIARLALFLASDESSLVDGLLIVVVSSRE